MSTATLLLKGKEYELPVTKGRKGISESMSTALRAKSGAITLDPGYGNPGSCNSAVTFSTASGHPPIPRLSVEEWLARRASSKSVISSQRPPAFGGGAPGIR